LTLQVVDIENGSRRIDQQKRPSFNVHGRCVGDLDPRGKHRTVRLNGPIQVDKHARGQGAEIGNAPPDGGAAGADGKRVTRGQIDRRARQCKLEAARSSVDREHLSVQRHHLGVSEARLVRKGERRQRERRRSGETGVPPVGAGGTPLEE
jgi:hypothetical protein